jgi:uncharacterized repeat protein (TIGR03803 family)
VKKIPNGWVGLVCALVFTGLGAARAQTAFTETVLHNFAGNPPQGAYPYGALAADAEGNLYGTTFQGGPMNAGVVFKRDSGGHYTVLHAFTGGSDGGNPIAGVILDSAGNLYGTGAAGGASGSGVIYKVDPSGQETVLYNLAGTPQAGVIRDAAGNLYGTTTDGGARHMGSVYKLDTSGQMKVLHSFSTGSGGNFPYAGVIGDGEGNLYGATSRGGAADAGVVYQLDSSGQETVLYSFTDQADGGSPYAGVIRDSAGNLYGTTNAGGAAGYGVVYKVDTAGQETVVYSFTGGADGGMPNAGVIRDAAGNLYGTTTAGGAGSGSSGSGVVYTVSPAGQETVLYTFAGGTDGSIPEAGVIRDAAGNLYGTTLKGGATGGWGTVFKVDTAGQETVLYRFPTAADGGCPVAGLTSGPSGSFYGTTFSGGSSNAGVVFKLDAAGETVLYSFTGGADGGWPMGGVISDSAGNLYGTASGGGIPNCTNGCGVVFKLDTTGHETVLYSFTGGDDGGQPEAGVVRDSQGTLYGTTYWGASGGGVVYKLSPAGVETVLASGGNPTAAVTMGPGGDLYTTLSGILGTDGAIQTVTADGSKQTVLYTFTGGAGGSNPMSAVLLDGAGNVYGTTQFGGVATGYAGDGVVYLLDAAGQETVLYTFTGGADGANPYGGVIRDSAGNLYGTTQYGPLSGQAPSYGVVYEVNPNGQETVLHTFTGGADGGYPKAGLVRDPAGNLYGTTCDGGAGNSGVVFKLAPR